MRAEDFALVARGMAPVLREHVASAMAPLQVQIAMLEQRLAASEQRAMVPGKGGEPGRDGKDGTSVTVADLKDVVSAEVTKAVAALPVATNGKDGASVDSAAVDAMVVVHVTRAVAALPVPKDGKDAEVDLDMLALRAAELIPRPKDGAPGKDGNDGASVTVEDLAGAVSAEVIKAVAALPAAKDGKPGLDGASVEPAAVETMVAAHVTRAVSALPVPKDGASVTVDDVRPLIASTVADAVRALPVAKDGVGLASVLIDRAGHLVLMLTTGETKDVGLVIGKDVDMDVVGRLIRDELAALPKPKDGTDGRDGFGFEDLEGVVDERGFVLRFSRNDGAEVKEFRVPTLLHRGVYEDAKSYEVGDVVTWGGSMWIAKAATTARPNTSDAGSRDWLLAVKRGGEGKPGGPGPKGIDGKDGINGRDLTQLGPDGRKW